MNPTLPIPENAHDLPLMVLASASARRRSMLRDLGVRHEVVPAGVDDGQLVPGSGTDPRQWVAALAYLKAASSLSRFPGVGIEPTINTVVIGADTVCVHDGRILGQPRDRDEARARIVSMSDAEHEVLTGVAIIDPASGRREIFIDRSLVRVGAIPEAEILGYLDSDEWVGKAGGYNITERLAAGWPIEFEGDETSIVGLPMTRTLDRVSRFFVD